MSKGKKQDSTEQKRERAELIARILKQHCPELHDLDYQNLEAKNDPPDLVFGEKDPDISAFPIGIELMDFHRGSIDESGSLLRRIEEQKEKITNAAWEIFRSEYPDEYMVTFCWYESDSELIQTGALPLPQRHEKDVIDRLVRLVSSQCEKASAEGGLLDYDVIDAAGLVTSLSSVYLARFVDDDGVPIPNWSSFSSAWIGVSPEQLERYIQQKEGNPFKHKCGQRWLVVVRDIEGAISTSMKFSEYRPIKSLYYDRVFLVSMMNQLVVQISPTLRVL